MNLFKKKIERVIGKTSGNFKKCIIDIGCSHNAPRGNYLKDKLNFPCIFIDPDLAALSKLQVKNDDLKLNVAMGEENKLSKLYCYQEGTHSLLKTNLSEIDKYIDGYTGKRALIKDWTAREEIYVPTFTLDTLVEDIEIKSIEALKIDAQGYDYKILLGSKKSLKLIKYIELEVQLTSFEVYKNQSKEDDIDAFMKENNFILVSRDLQTFDQEANLAYVNKALDNDEMNFYKNISKE